MTRPLKQYPSVAEHLGPAKAGYLRQTDREVSEVLASFHNGWTKPGKHELVQRIIRDLGRYLEEDHG